jgi:hypothetical protein
MNEFNYKELQEREKRRVRAYRFKRIRSGIRNVSIAVCCIVGAVDILTPVFLWLYSVFLEFLHKIGVYDYVSVQKTLGDSVLIAILICLWLFVLLKYIKQLKRKRR